jgi:putative hydrolase of the HAD superfamily
VTASIQRGAKQLLVFDGDDTLWQTEPLYDKARSMARRVVARGGLPGQRWEDIERSRDVENMKRLGVSRRRFPTSCVEAYIRVAREYDRKPTKFLTERVWRAASSVFDWKAPLVPHVRSILRQLQVSYQLVLLTKGDRAVQQWRIDESGLRTCFQRVFIRSEKDKPEFLAVLRLMRIAPSSSWSIGNSPRSDINPAIDVGMNAICVPAHVWEYEQEMADLRPGALKARDLTHVRDLLLSSRASGDKSAGK